MMIISLILIAVAIIIFIIGICGNNKYKRMSVLQPEELKVLNYEEIAGTAIVTVEDSNGNKATIDAKEKVAAGDTVKGIVYNGHVYSIEEAYHKPSAAAFVMSVLVMAAGIISLAVAVSGKDITGLSIIASLIMVAVAFGIGLVVYFVDKAKDTRAHAVVCEAEVVEHRKISASNGGYNYCMKLKFEVNGKVVTENGPRMITNSYESRYPVGTKLKIYYTPYNAISGGVELYEKKTSWNAANVIILLACIAGWAAAVYILFK